MRYMKLDSAERNKVMELLAGMQTFLADNFGYLTPEQARTAGADGSFSPVEQVWHLADLEREGFGERINKLQSEQNPHLPDFDGDRIARERDYRSLSLDAGLKAFAAARTANLARLQAISGETWTRSGTQDGVGQVSLCDMPVFIQQHDHAHIAEILAWKAQLHG